MNDKDNEFLNDIIDVPKQPTSNNDINQNLEYNFDFETQVKPEPVIDNNQVYQQPVSVSNEVETLAINNSTSSIIDEQSSPEILNFDTVENNVPPSSQDPNPEVNHELLRNLNDATNNLVNPDLIVNSSSKSLVEQTEVLKEEEPKVDYTQIKSKRNNVFIFIIFLMVIIFIIFLPKIVSLIGI